MREYELTIITPVGQDKLPIELEIYKHAKIKRSSVEITTRKLLPYPIGEFRLADYWYMDVKLEDGKANELSGALNTRDDVLRYLLVKKAPQLNNN